MEPSASTALHGAVQFLRAGMGEIALAVGVDKMYSTDRAKMFSAFESGWDVETAEENRRRLADYQDQAAKLSEGLRRLE